MYTVRVLPEAEQDLKNACSWYDKRQKGLGRRLTKEVRHYLSLLSKNPEQFSVIYLEKYRSAVLKTFPYLVIYKIDHQNKLVSVLSIFHSSRNPEEL